MKNILKNNEKRIARVLILTGLMCVSAYAQNPKEHNNLNGVTP